MNWTSTKLSLALIASLTAGAAAAQQTGAPVAVPGSANAAKVSNANRENTSDYNHLVGQGDGVSKKPDEGKEASTAVKATAADIAPGAALRDIKGVPIGTIVSIDGEQVVVDTGKTKIGVPLEGFGKDDEGLLLSITADQFNAAIEKAHAASQAQPAGSN